MTDKIPPRVRIEMPLGICLQINNPETEQGDYPACWIQKGLVLVHDDIDLSEEGLGFAVPVLKFGHETIFPGNAYITTEKYGDISVVKIDYNMNLVGRMVVKSSRRIESKAFYKIKECFSWLHRKYPLLRGILIQSSNLIRHNCGIVTRFKKIAGIVSVVNTVNNP